jgi:3-phosphoshikimate 1-carboxyvinyltransferase
MSESEFLRIRPAQRLSGTVFLPGDKSISHRALLLSALADGTSLIRNCLLAGVTEAMLDCLKGLGAYITEIPGETSGAADLMITGSGFRNLTPPSEPLYCRGSATTMRLLAGILAAQPFESTLDGNDRLRMRPMDRVVDPLRLKGASIKTQNGNAPLTFFPCKLVPSEHILAVASAQVKSALLLAGLFTDGPTRVVEPHRSRDHTERMLRGLGVDVQEWEDPQGRHVAEVSTGVSSLPPLDLDLPSDPSSAAFLIVAGLIVPEAELRLPSVCLNPARTGLFNVLESMAGKIDVGSVSASNGEPVGNLTIRPCRLTGTDVSGALVTRMIDEFPILAVAATQAHGLTVVSDAQELRLKESDRITALAEELNKMGAGIEPKPDGFTIRGPVALKGAIVDARGDHRLAMSLAVAGLVAEGETVIRGWKVLADSFPDFPQTLVRLGANARW